MNQKFFIHGKPNNQDICGVPDATNSLSGLIYNESFQRFGQEGKEYPYMRAELRLFSGNSYSVYTYCVPTVFDTSERKSYFAVTLISQGVYCNRMSELFSLFKDFYTGTCDYGVIDPSSGKYQVNQFSDAKGIDKLPSEALKYIEKNLSFYFVAIDKKFGSPNSKLEEVSIDDCDSKPILKKLFMQGAIEISREAVSNVQAKNLLEKYKSENAHLQEKVNQLEGENDLLARTQLELENKKVALSSVQKEYANLLSDNKELRSQVSAVKKVLADSLEKIKDGVDVARKDAESSEKWWLRLSRFIPYIILLCVIMLGFLCHVWISDIKKNFDDRASQAMTESVSTTKFDSVNSVVNMCRDTINALTNDNASLMDSLKMYRSKLELYKEEVARFKKKSKPTSGSVANKDGKSSKSAGSGDANNNNQNQGSDNKQKNETIKS